MQGNRPIIGLEFCQRFAGCWHLMAGVWAFYIDLRRDR